MWAWLCRAIRRVMARHFEQVEIKKKINCLPDWAKTPKFVSQNKI